MKQCKDRLAGVTALAVVAWPVASHAAVLAGRPDLMPAITAVMGLVLLLLAAVPASHARRTGIAIAMAAWAGIWLLAPRALVFVAPAALTAAVGFWFASSLGAGREPRVTTFARREHGGELPQDVAGYTRRLTLVWALLLFGLAAIGLGLAAFAPFTVWSTYANVASYAVIGGFFVAEYLWRRARFPERRHASFLDHVRNVMDRR